ncbi:MAG: hypothetical protein QM756_26780 [Polyangiaceae bacterium]
MFDPMLVRSFTVGGVAALLSTACLTPPPPGPEAPAQAPVAQSAAAAPSDAPAAAASGEENGLIWDGDEVGAGAKGWQDCDKKPGCKATMAPEASAGFNGTVGLKFHGEGPGWIGMGWNWKGWYPPNAGTDISGFRVLAFRIRIEAKNAEEAPDPGSLGVSIKCSSNAEKGQSNTASLVKYTKEPLIDGQWHGVELPIADMKKAEFDQKTAWEFVMSTWSPTARNFNMYLDDIRFLK